SKVERPDIRALMVGHLLNVDEALAKKVATGLRLKELPKPTDPARPVNKSLKPSAALSIIGNAPETFAGRKIGALISDGVDVRLLEALKKAAEKEGATLKLIAPAIGGVEASDGSWIEAHEKIDGGPSVLFDAIALLISEDAVDTLVAEASVRDFIADAFVH